MKRSYAAYRGRAVSLPGVKRRRTNGPRRRVPVRRPLFRRRSAARRRFAGRTRTKLGSRERPTGVSITQWSQQKRRYNIAKKRTAISRVARIVNSRTEVLKFAWSGLKNFDDHGYYWMHHYKAVVNPADPNQDEFYMPCYLYDLTACNNAGGAANPMVNLYFRVNGDAVFYANQHNLNSILDNNLRTEGNELTSALTGSRGHIKWAEIVMNCWGAKAKSVKYTIQVVRFTDEDLAPSQLIGVGDLTKVNAKRSAFWQNMLKSYTYNPSAITGGDYSKRMKVIKHQEFILDPNTTIEEDADPAVKNVRIFLNLDRIINFKENTPQETAATLDANTAVNITATNTVRPHAKPTHRIYLLVRASNFGLSAENSTNVDNGSFDLRVRTRWEEFL